MDHNDVECGFKSGLGHTPFQLLCRTGWTLPSAALMAKGGRAMTRSCICIWDLPHLVCNHASNDIGFRVGDGIYIKITKIRRQPTLHQNRICLPFTFKIC